MINASTNIPINYRNDRARLTRVGSDQARTVLPEW
jgi:hypothetical protein